MGHRSVMGALPQFAYRSTRVGEATSIANEETPVVVMLETPQALS